MAESPFSSLRSASLLSGSHRRHETTRNLLGNGLQALLSHPDQWQRLQQAPELIPGAVRELLRYDSPVQYTGRRVATELVLRGQLLRRVAQRLKGFDVRLLACDPFPDERLAQEAGVEFAPLEEVLRQSDFVSLHAPLNEGTLHLINAQTIELMKPGAILINTARGELVEDAALLVALKAGRLGGAGLDVLGSERDPAMEGITHDLLSLPNVICTQHTAGSTHEALARANMLAAQCVISVLEGSALPPECVVADGRTR